MIAALFLVLALPLAQAADTPRGPGDPPVPAVRARPLQPLAALFRDGDYPMEAAQYGAQGRVEFALVIGTDGRVRQCRVVRSSRITLFGTVTCEVLRRRARYAPARDAAGNLAGDMDSGGIAWGLRGARAPIPRPRRPN